jgi:hypothetical protein
LYASKGNLLPDPTPAGVTITNASMSGNTLSVSGKHGLPPGNWASDPAGDAKFPVVPVESANHPALDILETSVGDDGTNLTFTMKMADLSPAALADAATTGGTPSWMITWFEAKGGVGPTMTSGAPYSHWYVKWLGQGAFEYGMVSSINSPGLGAPAPKALTYIPSGAATGSVNGNVITISVPLASLGGLVAGDKIDHVIGYSLVEHGDATLNDWAEQVKSFSYVIGTPPAKQHFPDGYVQVSTDGFVTSTLAMLNSADNTWTASIPVSTSSGTVCVRQVLAKDLYTSLWDDVQAGPTACANFSASAPTDVVSRKTHDGAGTFDIPMPLAGTPGIESRGNGPVNDYSLVFSFPGNVTALAGATVTAHNPAAATGTVANTLLGPSVDQVTVNLTNVSSGQYITVSLTGITVGGVTSDVLSPQIGILVGDVDTTGRVDGNDVSAVQSHTRQAPDVNTFRYDVNATGRIDGNDVSTTQAQTRTGLPSSP